MTAPELHIHFETRRTRPPVYRMTPELIDAARARNDVAGVRTTLGSDLADLAPLASAVALVTSSDVLRDPSFPLRELHREAPHLRWIHMTGAGIEPLLPLDWLPGKTCVTNSSGVHAAKVREFALMALLMLNARMPTILTNQRAAKWHQLFTPCIAGRTVLVIGVGELGGAAATAAKSLGCRVLGVRRSGEPHPAVDEMAGTAAIEALLPRADFVVLATPLTAETSRLMTAERFDRMKEGAGFVNIGRGKLIDHEALAARLASGRLSGAILDVFEKEPLESGSPLWHAPNLVLTPHVSSDDADNYMANAIDLAFANARRFLAGEPLLNVVDPALGY